jgi:phosphatidylinositol alpha-mannosyltransferase
MRVGLVCPYSLSEPGGVQEQVLGLARALNRLGHDVCILAPGDVPREYGGISVGRAFRFPVNGSMAPMAPQPTAGARAVRAARAGRFDVLHVHEPMAPSITIPLLLAHPAPVVATFHAAGDHTPYKWFGPVLRRVATRIDARVAVSAAAAQLAQRHLGGSYQLMFNGIDVSRYRGPTIPRESGTILFLGRHEPRKGLDVLLDALAWLPEWVTVRVGGDGPLTARLRKQHHRDRRVHWLGQLTDAQKCRELRVASVLCAPARYGESFGYVLLEAMAAGTPTVATDVPGYRSLSGCAGAVLLVPPADPWALAAGLLQVLCDPHLVATLCARGDETVSRCSIGELARRYADLYAHVSA